MAKQTKDVLLEVVEKQLDKTEKRIMHLLDEHKSLKIVTAIALAGLIGYYAYRKLRNYKTKAIKNRHESNLHDVWQKNTSIVERPPLDLANPVH